MADQKRSPTRELSPQTALSDNPQEDWGEPGDEGATYSANHTRRDGKTELDREHGAKTRKANKDMVSRRT